MQLSLCDNTTTNDKADVGGHEGQNHATAFQLQLCVRADITHREAYSWKIFKPFIFITNIKLFQGTRIIKVFFSYVRDLTQRNSVLMGSVLVLAFYIWCLLFIMELVDHTQALMEPWEETAQQSACLLFS